MKKVLAVALAALVGASALAGCSSNNTSGNTDENAGANNPAAESGDSIRVGIIGPLTGEVSVYGISATNGAKLALDEINANGGVLGKQIDYGTVLDEKGDVSEATNAYNRLVNEGIVALIGDITSKPTMAVAELAAEDNLPMITPSGTALEITTIGPNVFRTCFTDPFQGKIMATFAADNLKAKNVAIIYNSSDDYSTGLTKAFKEQAAEKGITIVAEEAYGAADKDFKAQLTKITETKPDAIFVPDYYTVVGLIATQAREVGFDGPMLGADGWDGVLGVMDAGNISVLDNCYFSNHYSPKDTDEKVANFVSSYQEKYGEMPTSFSALGYDTAYMLVQAMEEAGSTDSQAVIDALKNIEFNGITGSIHFDENNNPIKVVTVLKIVDGDTVVEDKVSGE